MKRMSIQSRLYAGVLAVFLLFAAAFIVFQYNREKHYKAELLDQRLQDYNIALHDAMLYSGGKCLATAQKNISERHYDSLRITIIRPDGTVVYDNSNPGYRHFANHKSRPEVREALAKGHGTAVERESSTLGRQYFYSATYFKTDSMIIRSALPYDEGLLASLRADTHYLWFAIIAMVILVLLLYRFTSRLGRNISNLRTFAARADSGKPLEVEDLAAFPDDELGDIAERIIKIYKRLETTREEQNVLKRQLTQNIAHELKTPVASIQGYLETILLTPGISEATKMQFLERCYAQSKRLAALLQDISTLNRMDDAPALREFSAVDITAMVADIIKETALQRQEKDMRVANLLPSGVAVNGNASLLYSIFRNLMDNSIAYAGTGTTITIEAREQGDMWRFTFSDNGAGVPEEHLGRIFERFYRVDKGRSRKLGGTGLGLAIVKNAVILHGGTILARANEGGGLAIEFTIKK